MTPAIALRRLRSRGRPSPDDRSGDRGTGQCRREAVAPRVPPAPPTPACASPGRSSRPPAAARQLRPWLCARLAALLMTTPLGRRCLRGGACWDGLNHRPLQALLQRRRRGGRGTRVRAKAGRVADGVTTSDRRLPGRVRNWRTGGGACQAVRNPLSSYVGFGGGCRGGRHAARMF
jgi:hypothetical protein